MLSGKNRSALKSLANTLQANIIIGKNGITETVLKQIETDLAANELVKIKVLESSAEEAKELVPEILEATGAEFVSQLGSKIVIYRPAEKPIIQLPR